MQLPPFAAWGPGYGMALPMLSVALPPWFALWKCSEAPRSELCSSRLLNPTKLAIKTTITGVAPWLMVTASQPGSLCQGQDAGTTSPSAFRGHSKEQMSADSRKTVSFGPTTDGKLWGSKVTKPQLSQHTGSTWQQRGWQ
jgi:hypothetical protein